MQARPSVSPHSTRKWQHIRILLGIIIVCSGWGLLLQTSTPDNQPGMLHDTASHPA